MSGKVTIAIPTLNRAAYFRLALESARAQSYSNLEIVVSDNASTDDTPTVVAEFAGDPRIKALRQDIKLSMVENWNACVAAATGDHFLMLSDDDLLEPGAIAALVQGYEQGDDSVGMVYCRGRVIDENGDVVNVGPVSPARETAEDIVLEFFRSRRATYACSILFRRSDVLDGYTAELPLLTDAAQWMQAVARRGHAVFVERTLISYRKHLNISAMTPPAVWQKDSTMLAGMAVEWLRENGRGCETRYTEIRRAVEELNVRIVPDLINQRYKQEKVKALIAYAKHWRNFTSGVGVRAAAAGLLRLLVPGIVRIGKRLRPGQQTPSSSISI